MTLDKIMLLLILVLNTASIILCLRLIRINKSILLKTGVKIKYEPRIKTDNG